MSAARRAWQVEGLDHFTHTWNRVIDCHATSYKEALVTGWQYLFMFVPFDRRLYIVSLRAKPLDEEQSNPGDPQKGGALEFLNTSEDPNPW